MKRSYIARSQWVRKPAQKARRRAEKPEKAPTPQSLRKLAADAEYRVNRDRRMVQARMRCEFSYAGLQFSQCQKLATDAHHLKQRSTQVDHSVENLRVLCHAHHMQIHDHPQWAEANGWIVREYPQIGVDAE